MKKILLLATTPFLNDGLTKIEKDIFRYSKHDIDFSVASSFGFENAFGKELMSEGIACYKLSPKRSVLKYMIDIYKLSSEQDFDSVYIHGNSAMMFIEALPVWLAGKSRIITHCHNTASKYPFFHKLFKPFFNQIVTQKIACSKDAAEWAYCGENIKIVVNGVDVEKFAFDPVKREEKRKELGWDDAYIIGHIGRFNFQKNHSFLIEVFEKVQQKLPESRLLLIGTGELEDQIRKTVKNKGLEEKVCFLGNTDFVADYVQAMDVFVLPSLFEGLCLSAIEVQANGLPTIISSNITEETLATSCITPLSLRMPLKDWVEKIVACRSSKRKDTQQVLKEKGLDSGRMLAEIHSILLGE